MRAFALIASPRVASDLKSGAGNAPGSAPASSYAVGARCSTVFSRKLTASGTSRFESASNWRKSVQRKSPLARSLSERTRPSPRYAPTSTRVGDTTAWLRSLVGQMRPMIRRRESSGTPGHVLDSGSSAPRERPRFKFLCIRRSFASKCCATGMGYARVMARRWGKSAFIRETRGVGGEAM